MVTASARMPLGRFVIFTAQFGGADPVAPVLRPIPGVDHLVLTDHHMRVPRPWKVQVVDVPADLASDRLRNRYCKLHATRLLPTYDRSLYMDTHVQLTGDFTTLLEDFVASGLPLGLIEHVHSRTVAEEMERSLRSGAVDPADAERNWTRQRERQQAAGFRDDVGVYRGGVILRDHRQPVVARFEDAWWEELTQGVVRDQVALPFVLWSMGLQPFRIPAETLDPPMTRRLGHLPRRQRYGRFVRWFEARRDPARGQGLLVGALRPAPTVRAWRRRATRRLEARLLEARRPASVLIRWALRLLHPMASVRALHGRLLHQPTAD